MNNHQQQPYYHVLFSLLLLIFVTGMSACTTIHKQVLTNEYAAKPVLPDAVHVVADEKVISNCRKVAILRAEGEQPEKKMLAKLRKRVGKLGANTLLIVQSRRTTLKDVAKGVPEAAAAGALEIDAKTPPAQIIEATAYFCVDDV